MARPSKMARTKQTKKKAAATAAEPEDPDPNESPVDEEEKQDDEDDQDANAPSAAGGGGGGGGGDDDGDESSDSSSEDDDGAGGNAINHWTGFNDPGDHRKRAAGTILKKIGFSEAAAIYFVRDGLDTPDKIQRLTLDRDDLKLYIKA